MYTHMVAHVDYTDPSLVVCECGLIVHVNDPTVQLLDHEAFIGCDLAQACDTCRILMEAR